MMSHTTSPSSPRPEPARSATWPPPATVPTEAFKDDLDQHPERHFLSPMTVEEVYGWDSGSDSDFDDDEGEWNAGITDFSLFAADRKRAIESGESLDGKWEGFMQGQEEILRKNAERADVREGVPGLTPDVSPRLGDDLEEEDGYAEPMMPHMPPQITVPDYLTVEIKPSDPSAFRPQRTALAGPDDDLPTSLWFASRHKAPAKPARVQRPGLRHARTSSGRKHVWRRPGEDIFTVGEDVYGEEEAEREEDEGRGRWRVRSALMG